MKRDFQKNIVPLPQQNFSCFGKAHRISKIVRPISCIKLATLQLSSLNRRHEWYACSLWSHLAESGNKRVTVRLHLLGVKCEADRQSAAKNLTVGKHSEHFVE